MQKAACIQVAFFDGRMERRKDGIGIPEPSISLNSRFRLKA
jgi:hypothetical protein